MQLLNSKILSNDKNTRYSNKKAQDTRVTCAFCLLQLFRTTKMVEMRGFALQRLLPQVNRVQTKGFTRRRRVAIFQNRNKSPLRNKKRNSLRCSFFVFNIRKSYTKDIAIMLRFYKKRKKNQEYYPGLFSYYICTEYPTEQVI